MQIDNPFLPLHVLSDKIPRRVRVSKLTVLRKVPLASFGSRAQGTMAGTPVELSENS